MKEAYESSQYRCDCVQYRILIGFMLPSWFLSMWMSNTATTGMMIPVAEKVIDEMWKQKLNRRPYTATSFTAIHGSGIGSLRI